MRDKIYKLICIIICISCTTTLVGQTTQESMHDKYWFYRYRLTHEFLKKGLGSCGTPSGHSIPAGGAYQGDADLRFGDGTSFLGNYIGVLATEYALMKRDGASVQQKNRIKEELYFAMKAYERLDKNTEIIFNPNNGNCNNDINGFFSRDDVPEGTDYLRDFPTPISPNGNNKLIMSDYLSGKDASPCTKEPLRFVSPDQISNLLVGFSLVLRSVAPNDYFAEKNGGYYFFVGQAQRYTHAIMKYMNDHDYTLTTPNGYDDFGKPCLVSFGDYQTQQFAYAFAEAGNRIRLNNFGTDPEIVFLQTPPENPYLLNAPSIAVSQKQWQDLFNYPIGLTVAQFNYDHNDHNNAVYMQLAAIGNSWKIGAQANVRNVELFRYWDRSCEGTECLVGNPWGGCAVEIETGCHFVEKIVYAKLYCYKTPVTPETCSPFRLPEFTANTTSLALSSYGNLIKGWYFPLLHQYLHNTGSYSYNNLDLYNELKNAPCTGPHYKPYRDINNPPPADAFGNVNWDLPSTSEGVSGWRQDSRWEKSNEAIHNNAPGANNGIDYMIAYNLYHILKGGDDGFPNYDDLLNREVNNKSYPTQSLKGSNQFPLTLVGFETLTMNNTTFNSDANVTIHAGNSIKINNTSIKSGSTVKAYIDPLFGCIGIGNGDSKYTRTASNNNTPKPASVATMEKNLYSKMEENKESISKINDSAKNKNAYKPLATYLSDKNSSDISIFPNPATNRLYVQKDLFESDQVQIGIFDLTGIQKCSYTLNGRTQINETIELDISTLESGYYFCKVISGSYTKNIQFVKN